MAKLSVYIITYNEENKIEDALKSIVWADEIVVVDSYSADRTLEIVRRYTDRIVQIPFEGFGKLRNSAIAATSHEWVFSLDTDERCTEAARDEIVSIINSADAQDAYYIPRSNLFMGRRIVHSGWYPDYRQPQLFKRNALRFSDDMVHEAFQVVGGIGYLKNFIWQVPFRDLSQLIGKMERYSTLGAKKLADRGKSATMRKAFLHGLAAFCRHFVFKCGFLDGWPGFVIALGNFEGTFYRYAKKVEIDAKWPEAEKMLEGVIR